MTRLFASILLPRHCDHVPTPPTRQRRVRIASPRRCAETQRRRQSRMLRMRRILPIAVNGHALVGRRAPRATRLLNLRLKLRRCDSHSCIATWIGCLTRVAPDRAAKQTLPRIASSVRSTMGLLPLEYPKLSFTALNEEGAIILRHHDAGRFPASRTRRLQPGLVDQY